MPHPTPNAQPLNPSELIFPSAHTSLKTTLTSLKRHNLSILNRFHSILHDAQFVLKVASSFHHQLPLVANERCGNWYLDPSSQKAEAGSAYFKSTDGHHGEWSFSLRRLNLRLLDVVGEFGGCIIVDSTRRGKSMPDALSKTIPIWIAVMNRFLFDEEVQSHALVTPEDVVSRSEHAQIEDRVSGFVSELRGLGLDADDLRRKLRGKPMRAAWVTPDSVLSIQEEQDSLSPNLVVLCTASGRTSSEMPNPDYVQGAADDSESWACGLDAETFWKHKTQLMSTSEDELPAVIRSLVTGSNSDILARKPTLIKPTSNLWIANNAAAGVVYEEYDIVVSCSKEPNLMLAEKLNRRYIHLRCVTGKVGSRKLRAELEKLEHLTSLLSQSSRILVTCQTGRDLAVGVALALLCLWYCGDGTLQMAGSANTPTGRSKATVRQRLSWIMLSMPDAAPSRATLQSVNAFLLG